MYTNGGYFPEVNMEHNAPFDPNAALLNAMKHAAVAMYLQNKEIEEAIKKNPPSPLPPEKHVVLDHDRLDHDLFGPPPLAQITPEEAEKQLQKDGVDVINNEIHSEEFEKFKLMLNQQIVKKYGVHQQTRLPPVATMPFNF